MRFIFSIEPKIYEDLAFRMHVSASHTIYLPNAAIIINQVQIPNIC